MRDPARLSIVVRRTRDSEFMMTWLREVIWALLGVLGAVLTARVVIEAGSRRIEVSRMGDLPGFLWIWSSRSIGSLTTHATMSPVGKRYPAWFADRHKSLTQYHL